MKKWETIESNYLFKTPFVNLRVDKCILPNGIIIDEYYVNEYPDWVNVVAITQDKKIILVKQYRHGCNNFFLEIPAGGIKKNENIKEAILRELIEETGFTSNKAPILIGDFYNNPSIATNKIKTFLVIDAYKKYEQNTDETEELEVYLMPFSVVEEMINLKAISQMYTVTAYYLAKNYLEKEKL